MKIEIGSDIMCPFCYIGKRNFEAALTNPIYMEKAENDSKEGAMLGLTGVPFFIVDRKYAIVGAQPPAVMLQTLEKAFAG